MSFMPFNQSIFVLGIVIEVWCYIVFFVIHIFLCAKHVKTIDYTKRKKHMSEVLEHPLQIIYLKLHFINNNFTYQM